MKKATIARFVMGMAAIFAAGCSAEVGQDGVGESSQALSGTAPNRSAAGATITSGAGLEFAASCVIRRTVTENGNPVARDFVLTAGGIDSSGAETRSSYLYDVHNGSWAAQGSFGTASTDEVSHAKMAKIPGTDTKCLLVGGTHSGTAVAKTWLFDYNASPQWVAGPNLSQARADHVIAECAGSKLIVVGGNAGATYRKSAEVFDPSGTPSFAAPVDVMTNGRSNLAMVADASGTKDKFFIAGGFDGSVDSREVDLLFTSNTCGSLAPTKFSAGSSRLATGRSGLAVVTAGANGFIVTAGKNGTSLPTTTETYTVTTWAATSVLSGTSPVVSSTGAITGTYLPAVVKVPASPDAFLLIGGQDPSSTLTLNAVQEFQNGFSILQASPNALTDPRYGHVAEYAPSESLVYTSIGVKTVAGPTTSRLSSSEVITP